MFSARRPACCLMVLAAGCLAAPPAADEEQAAGDCEPIVENRFDDPARWRQNIDPGGEITREPDGLWITANPNAGEQTMVDLRSEVEIQLPDTELTAAFLVAGQVGGISWDSAEEGDYYDLVVDADRVLAVRRDAADGEHREICSTGCPPYAPDLHVWFRLRAAGGDVHYEVSANGRTWTEIANAPITELTYRSVAFAFANAPAQSELEVTAMAWAACER